MRGPAPLGCRALSALPYRPSRQSRATHLASAVYITCHVPHSVPPQHCSVSGLPRVPRVVSDSCDCDAAAFQHLGSEPPWKRWQLNGKGVLPCGTTSGRGSGVQLPVPVPVRFHRLVCRCGAGLWHRAEPVRQAPHRLHWRRQLPGHCTGSPPSLRAFRTPPAGS